MNRTQSQDPSTTVPNLHAQEPLAMASMDDDIALGCECANPALQIERWYQEALQPMSQGY
jgi:hypothetical protein